MPITINGSTDARVGYVASQMGAFSASMDGSHTAPANRAGSMNPTIGGFVSGLQGQVGVSQSFDGSIGMRFDSFSANLRSSQPVQTEGVATPEQIAIYLDASTYSQSATATCRYKASDGDWVTGHDLFRVQPGESNTPALGSVSDVFAWTIIDLEPGTQYDIEVTVTDSGVTTHYVRTTTKSLPAAAGTPNKTISSGSNSSTIQAAFNNLEAGDVLQFEDGSYTLSGVSLGATGTTGSPIIIRGESRTGVTLTDTSGDIIALNDVENVIIENLTIVGSGSDSGTSASSAAFAQGDLYTATNLTLRNLTVTGVDRFVDLYKDAQGVLVYDCTVTGNDIWDTSYTSSNITWNDAGIKLPGNGNCAFNNTIEGFGDTFSYASHSGSDTTGPGSNIHFYRNKVRNSCDDPIEVDHAIRNCTWYDNHITNAINVDSIDPLYGGPWISARNICINPYRVNTHKWNSTNSGMFLYNNTVVATTSIGSDADVANWYQPNQGSQDHWGYQNNIHVYRGSGQSVWMESSSSHNDIDFSNNAWYPDRAISWPDADRANLAAAQASMPSTTPIFSGKQRHEDDVIVTSDPFSDSITLGSDATTEITVDYTPTLTTGNAKNAGVAIPNITDGYSGSAPDMGAIISGRSVPTYGDRTALPSWYPGVGEIVEIDSGTTISSVALADGAGSFPGTADDDLCSPWSGGCIVTIDGQEYLAAMGGGHSDGAYNGIVMFGPLFGEGSNNPTWQLYKPASDVSDVQTAVTYSDGRQAAIHTYNYPVGVGDAVYSMASDAYYHPAGLGSHRAFKITQSGQTELATGIADRLLGCAAHYDGKIYVIGSEGNYDRLRIYDIATDSWSTEPNADIAFNTYPAAAVDTDLGGLLVTNGSSTVYWDLSDLSRRTGLNNPGGFDQSAIYDSARGTFVTHVSGSRTVYEVDAAAIRAGSNPSWSSRTFTGDTPSSAPAGGTFGRFREVPGRDIYVLAPSATSNFFVYRSA